MNTVCCSGAQGQRIVSIARGVTSVYGTVAGADTDRLGKYLMVSKNLLTITYNML